MTHTNKKHPHSYMSQDPFAGKANMQHLPIGLSPLSSPQRERWEEDTNFLPSLITGHDFSPQPYAIAQLQLRKPFSVLKPVLPMFLSGRKSRVEMQRILKAMALQTSHGVNWKSTFRGKSKKPNPQLGMLK